MFITLIFTLLFTTTARAADCMSEAPFGEVTAFVQDARALVAEEESTRQLYETLKADYLSAGFCDPMKMYNDVNKKPHPMLMTLMGKEMIKLAQARNWNELKNLTARLELDPALADAALTRLQSTFTVSQEESYPVKSPERIQNTKKRETAYIFLYQALAKHLNADPNFGNEKLMPELKRLKHLPPDGECRFLNYDAFSKAIRGQKEILKNAGPLGVKNKDVLTVVDYTIPMNQRRMFVFDLKNKIVMHNTYTGQGGGNQNGMSPDEFSNESGSNKSSDGFIVAGAAINSPTWGPAVALKGIDRNNNKMASREIILHAVNTPYRSYLNGDAYANMMTVKSEDDLDRFAVTEGSSDSRWTVSLYNQLDRSLAGSSSVSPTSGCLGVADTDMRHLDRKTRTTAQRDALDKAGGSQTEMLRQDLPGSVIFSYSGEEMLSKYLKD